MFIIRSNTLLLELVHNHLAYNKQVHVMEIVVGTAFDDIGMDRHNHIVGKSEHDFVREHSSIVTVRDIVQFSRHPHTVEQESYHNDVFEGFS